MDRSRKDCPICAATDLEVFLVRDRVPVQQNVLCPDRASAVTMRRGRLEMTACRTCGFVFNRRFDPSRFRYGAGYDNDQTNSPRFRRHVDGLVSMLVSREGVTKARIVEVGCGSGDFLRKLVRRGNDNRGVGYDPSHQGPATELGGRLRFRRQYYGPRAAEGRADVVVSRHVIEHVPDPVGLLRTVRATVGGSSRARLFFETPCVDWILEHRVVWDLYYEHCSLFSTRSLRTAFETAGFEVAAVKRLFGNQYLWLEASPAAVKRTPSLSPGGTIALARRFAREEERLRTRWRARLAKAAKAGPVAAWGAAAKGVTFLNLVDPDRRIVNCIIDLNPHKQGKFLPGTGHEIVAPAALAKRGVTAVVLMNPNYRAENEAIVRRLGLKVKWL